LWSQMRFLNTYIFYHKQIILSIVFLLSLDIIGNIKYNDRDEQN